MTKSNMARPVLWVAAFVLCLVAATALANSAPEVTNVVAAQRPGSFLVDVTYDLADADGDTVFVSLQFSPDGGATYGVLCRTVTGDVGPGVVPGTGKAAVWDARTDFPGRILGACAIRVIANDEPPHPYPAAFFRSALDGSGERALAPGDTIGFGEPFRVRWVAEAPSIAGMSSDLIAQLDTIYPVDGIIGYKHFVLDESCIPGIEDCWRPRRFNEATGDSFSYFGPSPTFAFRNDGSDASPYGRLLPSGVLEIRVNAADVVGLELAPENQVLDLVINHDPQTILLNGEADWAHPSDPEIYPYYIELDDPAQIHHPFQAGDRIPDRTYVVCKALGRDDRRDARLDPDLAVGFTGYFTARRTNTFGGTFSFASDASAVDYQPAWDAFCDTCWYADTLGFLTGPSTEFTVSMQSVDEHGRRDGTPPSLRFDVGYPPCLQCTELLAKSALPSAYPPDLACVDDPATHPCFQDTLEMRVTQNGVEPDAPEFVRAVYMIVDKTSYFVEISDSSYDFGGTKHVVAAQLYRMSVLLHARDDAREAWAAPVRRAGGFAYQVDYACDPYNLIKDGPGSDDIRMPLWGETGDVDALRIDPVSGLWRLAVDVVVPQFLLSNGADGYLLYLTYVQAGGDAAVAQEIFDATTRQFGEGTIQVVAYDQSGCFTTPVRPAAYNYFRGVRPSGALPYGQTWRDCDLVMPGIKGSLPLADAAMPSRNGTATVRPFRVVVVTPSGDFVCNGP